MVARVAGSRKTPDRVVQLLQEEVGRTSQAATARATGLTLRGVQNYLKGIGEPTTASLEKLAAYFERSVSWLRGEGVVAFPVRKDPRAGGDGSLPSAEYIAQLLRCNKELRQRVEGLLAAADSLDSQND